MKIKAFVSWSGGKETALAYYKITQNQDTKIAFFLNMTSEDGEHSRSHGVSSKLLKLQANIAEKPIIQRRTTWETYEEEFKKGILSFKKENIQAGVFGDIVIEGHRKWVEKVCMDIGIKPILPLWGEKREDILREFIQTGFEAVIVAVKTDVLDVKWVGRNLDGKFIEELKTLNNVDLCGEQGEYHTFVTGGPIFKKKIKILKAKKQYKDKRCFLDILDYEIIEKT